MSGLLGRGLLDHARARKRERVRNRGARESVRACERESARARESERARERAKEREGEQESARARERVGALLEGWKRVVAAAEGTSSRVREEDLMAFPYFF